MAWACLDDLRQIPPTHRLIFSAKGREIVNVFRPAMVERLVCLGVAVLAVGVSAPEAKAQWNEMLKVVPDSANAVVVVDIEALRSSPLGLVKSERRRKEGVRREFQKLLIGYLVSVEGLKPEWQVAVVQLPTETDPARFAEQVGSEVSELAGYQTVATPAGAYVAKISSRIVAGLSPATRQSAARWLGATSDSGLSPYLQSAAERAGDDSQIVAALDLKYLRSAQEIEQRLNTEYEFAMKKLDPALITIPALARFLSTVEGMTFSMNVGAGVSGSLRIDFGQPAVILLTSGAGKKLVSEVLKDMGAWLDDFENWDESAEGNTYILKGDLAITSAEDVLASFELDFDSRFIAPQPEATAAPAKSDSELRAEATRGYFQDLTDHLESLKDYKGGNAVQYANRFRREADKIEGLPTLNVDPDLVDFGVKVSGDLAKMSRMLKGARARGYVQQVHVGMRYRYGDWRSGRGVTGRREVAGELVPLMTIADEIDAGLAEIRRSLTDRYQVQF